MARPPCGGWQRDGGEKWKGVLLCWWRGRVGFAVEESCFREMHAMGVTLEEVPLPGEGRVCACVRVGAFCGVLTSLFPPHGLLLPPSAPSACPVLC